jgi:hypothetical protein
MMADPFDWRRAFSRLRFAHPEAALREIAAHLHHAAYFGDGRTDKEVLALLAQMIDPDEPKPAAGVKLELRRLKRKAPPVEPNYELRRFLEHRIDVLRDDVEAAVAEASAKFGASRSQCFRHLAVIRKYRKDMADWEQFLAKVGPVGE